MPKKLAPICPFTYYPALFGLDRGAYSPTPLYSDCPSFDFKETKSNEEQPGLSDLKGVLRSFLLRSRNFTSLKGISTLDGEGPEGIGNPVSGFLTFLDFPRRSRAVGLGFQFCLSTGILPPLPVGTRDCSPVCHQHHLYTAFSFSG